MSKQFSLRLLVAATAMASAQGTFAQAQGGPRLEEVVVTAQKREQSLQDVPIAVQALDGDSLTQNGIGALSDISNITAGVKLADTQGSYNTASMRGVSSLPFGFGLEQSVPFFLDGIYLGNGFSMLGDLLDVQQIEVLKGPQGTLFGRNASGGAINVRTHKPSDELKGSLSVSAGNYDLRTARGVLNVPIVPGELALRGGFSVRDRDGWQTNVVTGEEDGFAQDRWAGFAKLRWNPADNLELLLASDWSQQRDHQGYLGVVAVRPTAIWEQVYAQALPEAFFDENSRDFASADDGFSIGVPGAGGSLLQLPILPASPVDIRQRRKISGHALTLTWDMDAAYTLTSMTSYREVASSSGTDADASNLGLVNSTRDGVTEEFNQELRLDFAGEAVDWFVGLNAYRQNRDDNFWVSTSSLVPLSLLGPAGLATNLEEAVGGDNKTESYAVFGDATWHINKQFDLTAGLRYTYDAKSFRLKEAGNDTFNGQGLLFPNLSQLEDPDTASEHENWSNLSGRIVGTWFVSDSLMTYASVSQGYKAGGYNTTLTVQGDPVNGFYTPVDATKPFDEETNINFELGLKSDWLDGRLRLNTSVFHYVYKDLQFLLGDSSTPVARTINAAEVTGNGWDGDVHFLVTEGFSLSANFSLLDVTYSEDVLDKSGTLRTEEGTDRPWSPEFSGTVAMDYEQPLGDYGTLRATLSYNYTGKHLQRDIRVTEDFDPAVNWQDAYGIMNARLTLYSPSADWEVALWGKNLLDEGYRGFTSGSAQATGGLLQAVPGEPLTFGIDASYHF